MYTKAQENDRAIFRKVQKSVQKNLIATVIMAGVFILTNCPYSVIWFFDYLAAFERNLVLPLEMVCGLVTS